MATYRTFRELGLAVQRERPDFRDYDPEEVGRRVSQVMDIQVGDDRSFGDKAIDDLGRTVSEEVGGLVESLASPIETAKGMGMIAGGAADIALGTDFVDDEVEKLVRTEGRRYVDEIKNFENRPFRAAANLALVEAEAKATIMKSAATSEADWERIMAQGSQSSWKDEWLTGLFSIPLVLVFTGDKGREIVANGFAALEIMPEWYQYTLGVIVAASFGIRSATKFFGRK